MDLMTLGLLICYSLGCILLGVGIGIIFTERRYESQEEEDVVELTEALATVGPKAAKKMVKAIEKVIEAVELMEESPIKIKPPNVKAQAMG